ncbi:AB abhydrolase [Paramecium bursaria Chlorella virus CviKI]|nr:AB abhydrolase [Paramecium bursaria Chlorella virus CviKI]
MKIFHSISYNMAIEGVYKYFVPATNAIATFIYFHGYGSYAMNDLQHVLKPFARNGINIATIDYPGHGHSNGDRFEVNFEQIVSVAKEFVQEVKEDEVCGNVPIFIGGTSLGGAVASKMLELEKDARHGFLISPMYQLPKTFVNKIGFVVVPFLTKFFPNARVLKPNSHPFDEEFNTRWFNDPLTRHGKITFNTANELAKLSNSARVLSPSIDVPMTCFQSVLDTQVDFMTNIELFNKTDNRSVVVYTDSWHPLLVEKCRDDIIKRMIDTIKSKV